MEMQKHIRAGVILLAIGATLFALSCGGKQSMASKSAAAYRDAVAKGIPVGSGEHGGHAAAVESSAEAGGGHDNMAGMDHSQMQHGSSSSMASMPGMQHGSTAGMSGMDHSKMHGSSQSMTKMPGMQHGSMAEMSGMDHSQMQHGSTGAKATMPGMQHGSMPGMSNMPGMQHGATAVAPVPPAPTNSSAIAKLNPSATLSPDSFDQPAPSAVSEANKAGAEGGHMMQQPASPQPKPPDHSHHGANSNRE
jgi:hypothetical protein